MVRRISLSTVRLGLRPAQLLAGAIFGFALATTTPVIFAASGSWSIPELMRALRLNVASEASFVESKQSSYLKHELLLKGRLSFSPPDRLEKEVQEPYQQRIVIEGDHLEISGPEASDHRELSIGAHPQVKVLVESFRATLTGDLELLKKYYDLKLTGYSARWELILSPATRDLKAIIYRVRISGRGKRIYRIETEEIGGDETRMDLRYQESNQ